MLRRHFLMSLSMCFTISALNTPEHDIQLPLIPEHENNKPKLLSTRVVMALRENGNDKEHQVEILLHTTVFPVMLHTAAGFIPARINSLTRCRFTKSLKHNRDQSSHRTRPVGIAGKARQNHMQNHTKYQRGGARSRGLGNGAEGVAMVCSKRWSRPIRR
jgi:hypothetical protein